MRIALLLLTLVCAPAMAEMRAAVKTLPLSQIAIHPQREASAQSVSLNLAKISAEIGTRIVSIPVEPGQRIAKGTVIAQLDCIDPKIAAQRAQAGVESAQARMKLAQQQLERSRELASRNFISSAALDAKQTDLDIAAAELKLNAATRAATRRDVGKCILRSPYPAIVESRLAQVGELASPGTPLVELWDTSRMQLSAQVQQADAEWLHQAHPVFVSQGREYAVKLLRVSPAVNLAARTREARFNFGKTAPAPGSNGVLRWRDPRAYLPADYLVARNRRLGVFVLDGSIARFVPLAEAQEGRPAAADDLPAHTRIITDGRFQLQDGMSVNTR